MTESTRELSPIEQIRMELQTDLQKVLMVHGDALAKAGETAVPNVIIGEIGALLGDTMWRITSSFNYEGTDLDEDKLSEIVFGEAAQRAAQVYNQLNDDVDVEFFDSDLPDVLSKN